MLATRFRRVGRVSSRRERDALPLCKCRVVTHPRNPQRRNDDDDEDEDVVVDPGTKKPKKNEG